MNLGIPSPPKRKIGLTPLIDVVFILLLFFMLASSFTEWREINLNVAGSKGNVQKNHQPLIIRITHDALILKGERLSHQVLMKILSESLKENAELVVVLQPQASVPLQKIVTLLDLIREQGIKSVSFVRDKERGV